MNCASDGTRKPPLIFPPIIGCLHSLENIFIKFSHCAAITCHYTEREREIINLVCRTKTLL
jgi:hypothetical protein